MSAPEANKEYLKGVSSALARIHKTIMENEMELLENKRMTKFSPADRLHILLNDPEFVWLRTISQMMSSVDEVYFQKEIIQDTQVEALKNEIQSKMLQSNETEFSKKYRSLIPTLPDLMPLHGLLKVALNQKNRLDTKPL